MSAESDSNGFKGGPPYASVDDYEQGWERSGPESVVPDGGASVDQSVIGGDASAIHGTLSGRLFHL